MIKLTSHGFVKTGFWKFQRFPHFSKCLTHNQTGAYFHKFVANKKFDKSTKLVSVEKRSCIQSTQFTKLKRKSDFFNGKRQSIQETSFELWSSCTLSGILN